MASLPERRALVGIHYIGYAGAVDEDERDHRSRQMLSRALNIRNVLAFVGSGVSRAYGHPNWERLVSRLAKKTLDVAAGAKDVMSKDEYEFLKPFADAAEVAEGNGASSPRNRVHTGRLGPADRNVLVLDLCEEIFERVSHLSVRRGNAKPDSLQQEAAKILRENKGKQGSKPASRDPLRALIEQLDIRRFLTTNYDMEIEEAFDRAGIECSPAQSPASSPRSSSTSASQSRAWSLSVEPEQLDTLARFAVQAPGFEYGVLHLHGVTAKPTSLILTESDYQRLYLTDDAAHRAYRQVLNVVFGGNAILFVGVGMQEVDLLRPLRQFVSERTADRHERPLFALLRTTESRTHDLEYSRYLNARFGVKVLHYSVKGGQDEAEAITKELLNIRDQRHLWWKSWQTRPPHRTPDFYDPDTTSRIRHFVTLPAGQELIGGSLDAKAVLDKLSAGPKHALLVTGDPGTGKGTLGQLLVTQSEHGYGYTRRFFATAHFTNEIRSIVEAAATFFTEGPTDADPFNALQRALLSGKHLLVLGGIERLFPRNDARLAAWQQKADPDAATIALMNAVQGITGDAARLLALVKEVGERGPGHVVLTSTTLPPGLTLDDVHHHPLRVSDNANVLSLPGLADLPPGRAIELCDVLNWHAYAVLVTQRALAVIADPDERKVFLDSLCTRLTALDFEGRPTTAIALVWEMFLRKNEDARRRLSSILQHASLFTTPVSERTLLVGGPLDTYEGGDEDRTTASRNDVASLIDARFLIPIKRKGHPNERRVTAHTLVRNVVLRQLGCEPDAPGEAQRFELSAWSAEAAEITPGTIDGHRVTTSTIDLLLDYAEVRPPDDAARRAAPRDNTEQREAIRGAFGVLRSRFSATTVPRLGAFDEEEAGTSPWPHCDAYQRRLVRLLNCLRSEEQGIFYKDELVWLYNELALVAFSQGLLADAYALYMASFRMSEIVEVNQGVRCAEAKLGLGLVLLERGRLKRSRILIMNALRLAANEPLVAARVTGHLGLVEHLSGDYTGAEECYKEAIKKLNRARNTRAESIFRRHLGDLYRMQRQHNEARREIEGSIAAAEGGRHADLLQQARVAEALLRLSAKEKVGAQELDSVREFARRVGLRKLDWDARIAQAQVALDDRDTEFAGRLAVQCLHIASANSLRLRLTGSLIMLGRVSWARGNIDAGDRLVRSAQALAERQGNQLLFEKGERLLAQRGRAERAR